MTEEEALSVLAPLVVAFGFEEDRYDQWWKMMVALDDVTPAMMAAAELVRTATDTYVPGWGRFQAGYDRFVNEARIAAVEEQRALKARTPAANHCDGSGWIPLPDGGQRPCDACNPYLADIYNDPPRWERYLDGVPLFSLHDDVKEKDRRPVVDTMPPPCRIERWHDPAEAVIPPSLGLQVARRAYIEERESQGLPVDTGYFDEQIRRALERDYEEE